MNELESNIFKFKGNEKVIFKKDINKTYIILQRLTVDYDVKYLIKKLTDFGEEFYVNESDLKKI